MSTPEKKDPRAIAANVRGVQLGSAMPPKKCVSCGSAIKHEEASEHCNSDCAENARRERTQQDLRAALLLRDKGVCQNPRCGIDCEEIRRQLDELKAAAEAAEGTGNVKPVNDWKARVHQLVVLRFPTGDLVEGRTLWNAAHIDARVFNGPTTLANATTLCLRCHKVDTKGLAGRRSNARRGWR